MEWEVVSRVAAKPPADKPAGSDPRLEGNGLPKTPTLTPDELNNPDIAGILREVERTRADKNLSPEKKQNILDIYNQEIVKVIANMPSPDAPNPSDEMFNVDKEAFRRKQNEASPRYGFSPQSDILGAGVGAAAGAGVTGASAVKQRANKFLGAIEALPEAIKTMKAPTAGGGAPAGGLSVGNPYDKAPVGGQGTYNYAKQFGADEFEARNAQGMNKGQVWSDIDAANAAKAKIAQLAPEMAPVAERAGLYLPTQVGGGPRGAPTAPIPKVEAPKPSPLASMKNVAGAVLNNPIVRGGLTGAGLGAGAAETYDRARSGDVPGALLSGVGTVGGLAPAPVGPLIAGGSLGALSVLDKTRNKLAQEAQTPQAPATPEELQQAQQPARVFPSALPKRKTAAEITSSLEQDLANQLQDFASQQV